ncbi:MAG: hypothetical protein DBX66_05580, partial [Clostridiales bacterium]
AGSPPGALLSVEELEEQALIETSMAAASKVANILFMNSYLLFVAFTLDQFLFESIPSYPGAALAQYSPEYTLHYSAIFTRTQCDF